MDITEKLKVIIVATDFSAESDKAVDFAAALVISALSIFGILIPSISAMDVLIVLAITLVSMVVIDEFKSFIFRHYKI